MPLVQGFIENVGQLPSAIHYYLPVPNGLAYITNHGYGYVRYRQRPRDAHPQRTVSFAFIGTIQ